MGNSSSDDRQPLISNDYSSGSSWRAAESQYGYQRLQEEPERNYGGGSSGTYWDAYMKAKKESEEEEEVREPNIDAPKAKRARVDVTVSPEQVDAFKKELSVLFGFRQSLPIESVYTRME